MNNQGSSKHGTAQGTGLSARLRGGVREAFAIAGDFIALVADRKTSYVPTMTGAQCADFDAQTMRRSLRNGEGK